MDDKKINEIEGFSLSIAQWEINEQLSEVLGEKFVFIAQVFISEIPITENEFKCTIKAFKIKVHFTTLYELQFDKGGHVISTPSIEGKISFEKIIKGDFAYWTPYGVDLEIKNYLGVSGFKHFCYNKEYKSSKGDMFKTINEKRKRFEDFSQKFSRKAFPLGVSIAQEV